MAGPSFEKKITSHLHKLSPEQQIRVLAFIQALAEKKPLGVPGSQLLQFAGVIDLDDLKEIEKAIDEGCKHV